MGRGMKVLTDDKFYICDDVGLEMNLFIFYLFTFTN